MKRVFLDTNILVDYIQARAGGDDAKQLLMRGRDGEVSLFASFLTFANMAYILNGKADIYELFAILTSFITVLPMDSDQLQAALLHRAKDFEDMLQYQCAKVAGCDIIVTGNKRHFKEFSDLPLMTANELLTELAPK
ncbi:MAG: PIN domain-containing protein [Prevotella sp.]|jgi:predicted nucleic acid-binding protein|nr:PIN domain-containing protein [Prevotella sp.]